MKHSGIIRVVAFLAAGALGTVAGARGEPTEFYVDYARATPGDGSAVNPWKTRSNVNWATVSAALRNGPVTVYFSSRAIWNDNQSLTIPVGTNTTGNVLVLDGQSRFNSTPAGPASWQDEADTTALATFSNGGGTGGMVYLLNDNSFVTIRGFRLLRPTWGGISIGSANPTLNIHDILVEGNIVDSPANNHGIWFGYAEAGCFNVTVRRNTISNTPLEGIYMGHYSYLPNTITGTVVEYNTLINTGTVGEGDIDIKPGNFGAVVRYNTSYSGATGGVLAGIVVMASDVQVYGNELRSLRPRDPTDGGNGIQVNADGDGRGNGKALDNIVVYNNLILGNAGNGVSVFATANGASVSGLKVLNNTVVSNQRKGFKTSGDPITIASFQNNIFQSNVICGIDLPGNVAAASVDHNASFGSAALFMVQGRATTWSEWQGLGFDANGLAVDPQLDVAGRPLAGAPVIDAGNARGEFSLDKDGGLRVGPWDIGAYEYGAVAQRAPAAPSSVRVLP